MLRIPNVTNRAEAVLLLRAIHSHAGEANLAQGGIEGTLTFAGQVHTARYEPHTESITVTSNALCDASLKDRMPDFSRLTLEGDEARISGDEMRKMRRVYECQQRARV